MRVADPWCGVSTAIAPKTQLGKYQLVRHLASGGMADLWLATVTGADGVERHVAIKRIRKEQAGDRRFVQMYLDEARHAASLHHKHVVTIHEVAQAGGEAFVAMEWVHGEDLRRILAHAHARGQHLPIEHVMSIALASSSALQAAHDHKRELVHRDVSPSNIIVGYDGNVKVIDFGIAKAALSSQDTQPSGGLAGKVAYLSPEQCLGQPCDRRSDIYSLGVVLYELVTVRRLFKSANDFLTMSTIIHGNIPVPSLVRTGIPPELEGIIMRALSHERADRFQTAAEMRAALERFCAANFIRTSPPVLADYMRIVFGPKQEPWLIEDPPDLELAIDFDGPQLGVVPIPEAALQLQTVPVAPPIHAATPVGDEATDIVAPLPLDDIDLPSTDGPLSVGDETMMVRPTTVATGRGKQLALIAVASLVAIVIAYVVIRSQRSDDAPRRPANPNINLPPPSIIDDSPRTPDAAPSVDDKIVVPDEPAAGSARGPDPKRAVAAPPKKKVKRPGRRRTSPKPPSEAADTAWDPKTLLPPKK